MYFVCNSSLTVTRDKASKYFENVQSFRTQIFQEIRLNLVFIYYQQQQIETDQLLFYWNLHQQIYFSRFEDAKATNDCWNDLYNSLNKFYVSKKKIKLHLKKNLLICSICSIHTYNHISISEARKKCQRLFGLKHLGDLFLRLTSFLINPLFKVVLAIVTVYFRAAIILSVLVLEFTSAVLKQETKTSKLFPQTKSKISYAIRNENTRNHTQTRWTQFPLISSSS